MLARVRDTAGRVATVAGSAVLTAGLATDTVTLPGILAAAATAGIGLATNSTIRHAPESVRGTAIALYTTPHAGAAAVLIGEFAAPDSPVSLLAQAGAVVLWTGTVWRLRPGALARQAAVAGEEQELTVLDKESEETPATAAPVVPDPSASADPAARWWAEQAATESGLAPHTVLLEHAQVSKECVALIVGAAEHGMPVPTLSTSRLSALLDVPEDLIEVTPVPGRGAGVRLVVIGRRPEADSSAPLSTEDLWREIAATAMPGVELIESTTYTLSKELSA